MDTVANLCRQIRDRRQEVSVQWVARAFGARFLTRLSRAERVIEEAIELVQALGLSRERVHALVDKIYAKAPGEVPQEIGGLSLSLLALGQVANYSVDQCEVDEINRVLALPDEHFQRKLAAKIAEGIVTEEAA